MKEFLEILRHGLAAKDLIAMAAMGGLLVAMVRWIEILEAGI